MINAIAIDDEPLALKVISSHCEKTEFIQLQKTFTQSTKALKYLKKFPIDLIFVDIRMPAVSGINLVRSLRQNPMVIFTTAFSEYAVTSYELNAIDYLLKPISYQRFQQAVIKANEYYQFIQKKDLGPEKYLFVRADYRLIKIAIDDIEYIESMADYLRIHLGKRKPLVVRMTMKEMLEKLPSDDFIRVHRSYILPFSGIQSVHNNTIYLETAEIPIGRTYLEDFFGRYKI